MRLGCLAPWLLVGALAAQATDPAALRARCEALAPERRAEVARTIEQRLVRARDEHLQRIQSSARGQAAYLAQVPSRWFEPSEFAPVAPPRRLIGAGTGAHRTATAGMRPFVCLPGLHRIVTYDWGRSAAVHGGGELTAGQRLANYANGLPPAADHAVARVLAALDLDPQQRRLAAWFEHLYADRQGQVFAGVSLFDAWCSGRVVEMPDVDAIAFARRIRGDRSYVSPIPADARRTDLYEQVRLAFVSHREYRTLRLVLAATYVAAHPEIDPVYAELVPRCHWLWRTCEEDPQRLARMLADAKDRTSLLTAVDAELRQDSAPAEQRCRELADMAVFLQQALAAELAAGNG